ncbi:MAG: Crp/Fnr family transcriptional regulator [Bacteroidota bacterium]
MTQPDSLRALQIHFPFLQDKSLNLLGEISKVISLPIKDHWTLLTQAEAKIGFVLSGILRGYYVDEAGHEHTIIIRKDGQSIGTPSVLQADYDKEYRYQALGASIVLEFNAVALWELSRMKPDIHQMVMQCLFENILTLLTRVESLVAMKPRERYQQIWQQQMDLFRLSPQKFIAEYIGITPVSLSRMHTEVNPR